MLFLTEQYFPTNRKTTRTKMLNSHDSRLIALAIFNSTLPPLDLLDIRDDILNAENDGASEVHELPIAVRSALHLD